MRAVTFQAPGEVAVAERAEPQLDSPQDATVKIDASGICGSDLHIYHGRVKIEPGFTIGHEFVGTVIEAGDQVLLILDPGLESQITPQFAPDGAGATSGA